MSDEKVKAICGTIIVIVIVMAMVTDNIMNNKYKAESEAKRPVCQCVQP